MWKSLDLLNNNSYRSETFPKSQRRTDAMDWNEASLWKCNISCDVTFVPVYIKPKQTSSIMWYSVSTFKNIYCGVWSLIFSNVNSNQHYEDAILMILTSLLAFSTTVVWNILLLQNSKLAIISYICIYIYYIHIHIYRISVEEIVSLYYIKWKLKIYKIILNTKNN